jgi:hypothetical protein
MKELHQDMCTAQRRVAYLQEKLRERIEVEGEEIEESMTAI